MSESPDNPLYNWGKRYYHDPVLFVREVLGVEPYVWQIELMTNIARTWALPVERVTSRDRKHSVRSGHRVGKSTVLGWIALWAICTRFRVKVIITAPTSQQLYDALFAEMKSWARKLPPPILSMLTIKADRIELNAAPEDAFIAASTSRQESPEALQGKHSDWVLLIGDEASGIPEAVFEASAGSMAARRAIMLLTSNPVRGSGYFYETHNQQSDNWTCYHVDSRDIENVDRVWVQDMIHKYGEDSNAFRIRVEGNFPKSDSNTIISLESVLTAIDRDIRSVGDEPEYWGLDVAYGGEDSSALTKRTRREILEIPKRYRIHKNNAILMDQVQGEFNTTLRRKPQEIMIDVIGWGAGAVDIGRRLKLPVMGINVAETTTVEKANSYLGAGYANQRAEGWFEMAEWFSSKQVRLPPMPPKGTAEYVTYQRYITELTMVRYRFGEKGKLLVESKDELRDVRKVGSPDMAESTMLTFLGRAAILQGEGRYQPKASLKRVRKGIV